MSANVEADMAHAEHGPLLNAALVLTSQLQGIDQRLMPISNVSHAQHYDLAERARSLALYLSGTLQLTEHALYPQAFALLRAALEHQLTDRLLFRADRYQRRFVGVTRQQWKELQEKRDKGAEGTQDILDLAWKEHKNQKDRGELTIVRSGIHQSGAVKPGAPSLSYLYYILYLEGYDPFHPRPDDDGFLQPGFVRTEADRGWFDRNRQIYRETRWESLKSNLRLNGLGDEGDLVKLDVHYRFLSAYTHPAPAAYDLVYGRNRPTHSPKYDHYASELTLLYVIHLAADELNDFRALADREPRVDIAGWEEIEAKVEQAKALASHLWYVGDPPHAYDFFDEANSRAFRDRRWEPGQINSPPESIPPEEVRYYHNPLERLKRLHSSLVEGVTGFQYVSPWPRGDAWR